MSKRLLTLDAVLVLVAVAFAGVIVRELRTPPRLPVAAAPVTAPAAPAAAASAPTPESYTIVASKNLFSPTRTENPVAATGTPGAAGANIPKPNLYGVVLRDGAPIAYLEDPVTKRVAGYRVGDAVAGGTLKSIARDRVVLARPEGSVDVTLRDPGKPKPAAPPAPAAQAPAPQRPAVLPDGTVPLTSPPPAVGIQTPQVPPQRPLPPNLLRRLPQAPPAGDVPR
ncbi:MAG: hypothetical protein HY216_10095 [Candidatus Rokubacteria bacterium]|nr:hypothetical protein [Candidatus Rokubacteria bacterium]